MSVLRYKAINQHKHNCARTGYDCIAMKLAQVVPFCHWRARRQLHQHSMAAMHGDVCATGQSCTMLCLQLPLLAAAVHML